MFGRRKAVQRPLDITVAAIVFVLGVGQLLSTSEIYWSWLLDATSIYFIVAAITAIVSILYPREHHSVAKFVIEMFSWTFIAFAAAATCIVIFVSMFQTNTHNYLVDLTLFWIWVAIAIGTGWRAFVMRLIYKGGGRNG